MSFPNPLSDPKPLRLCLTGAGARLALLLAMCLGPRIWMADRIGSVCPDGAFYIEKAQHLGEDGPPVAQDSYDFNLYLLLLSAWHHAGLSWEAAGTVWGILAGSLTVLPLFGWMRRMFDDRVALLAGALYAAHPKLIEWSPEALRDPTYWLLFTTSLYCSWRAITEVRPAWFLAAGGATFLAASTRFEGWFLLLPATAWCGWRWLALREGRWRLLGGAGLFALGYPLVMALLVYFHGYQRWEWGKFERLEMVAQWARARWNAPKTPSVGVAEEQRSAAAAETAPCPAPADAAPAEAVATVPPAASAPLAISSDTAGQTASLVLDKVGRAFTAVFGVPVLLGLLRWWRLCARRDHQPLVLLAAITLAAVWVHASKGHMSSTRYLLPLVILSTPLAALGLLPVCRLAARLASWLAPGQALATHWAATGVLLAVLAGGAADAISSRVSSRTAQADLGAWLGRRIGTQQTVAGSFNWRLTTYHAQAKFHPLPYSSGDLTPEWFGRMLNDTRPAALLLCHRRLPGALLRSLTEQAGASGFEPVNPEQLPPSCRNRVTVLVRRPVQVADRRQDRPATTPGDPTGAP